MPNTYASVISKNGGEVRTDAVVLSILVRDDKAVGLVHRDACNEERRRLLLLSFII